MKKAKKKSKKAVRRPPTKKKAAPRTSIRYRVTAKPKKPHAMHGGESLSADQLQKFREILTQKRDDLLAVVQRKKEQELQDTEVVGDEADIATQSVEKEILFELTDSEKQSLDMVEAALRKLEKGSYGVCESCQKIIPRLRLEIMPWARYCVTCQSEQEVAPVEPPL